MRLLSAHPGRLGALAAALLLAAASAGAARAGTPTYSVTALGDFGATVGPDCGFDAPHWSAANAIDNAGDVVGWSSYYRCGSTIFGALWSGGTITDLGTFPPPNDYQNSVATALNGSGQIAGRSGGFSSPFPGYPFLYDSGTMTNLGTFGCDSSCANLVGNTASGINASGQIVGWAYTGPPATARAFLTSGGPLEDLGTLGGPDSYAYGISDSGQISGKASIGSAYHAFLASGGTMQDLGTLGGSNSSARAVNALGVTAGYSELAGDGSAHAFVDDGAGMLDLGTLGGPDSAVQALNRWGQAAGFSTVDPAGPHSSNLDRDPAAKPTADLHAFVASGGAMQDLNGMIDPASGWTLLQANGINDRGQIVGIGVLAGASGPQAFLLNDVLPPSIFLVSPANRAVYTLGQSVSARYSCTDAGSGVATCAGPVPSGGRIDTSRVGPHFFVVTASDHAGFRSRAIAGYSVHYVFSGFFRPLDNPPALNAVRGGSTVPVKFGLAGDQGLQILAAGSPSSAQIDCDTGSRLADAEPAAGTLGYDVTAGTYTYEWKTSAAWTDTCRQLDVALVDGTVRSTLFRFR